jgi:hypothetical protein
MNRFRKIGKWALVLVALFIVVQISVSLALGTRRMHGYLIAHLERAFGRPVQVNGFSAQIFPLPRLEMDGITVGEDPGFGNEYFLRAEKMQAGLRWMGLLRGHFEFGTMSLTRPSLILVHNERGQWNLEGWLPPAEQSHPRGPGTYGPHETVSPNNYLEKIEFDDGRINFKTGDVKRAFAFTDVSGSVEQEGPGRWQLKLEAKPWRSGVVLQSAGILYVRGEVAGTSSRLQPAHVQVHWDKVSLADLFRLATGNDSGVRGEFGLDGSASVGTAAETMKNSAVSTAPGKWNFELETWATQVHRWDLAERGDNPRVNVHAKGVWDLRAGEGVAQEIKVDLPRSNLRGAGKFGMNANTPWNARIESAAVDAQDLLAWFRAFQPDVAEGLAAEQIFSGDGEVHGWPVHWDTAHLTSSGGLLHVPGIAKPLRIGAMHGGLQQNTFVIEPVRVSVDGVALWAEQASAVKPEKPAAQAHIPQNWAEFRLFHDGKFNGGELLVNGHLDQAELFFKTATAFGKTVNHGWELGGGVSTGIAWGWKRRLFRNGSWNGTVNFSMAELQLAGLNQPIVLENAVLLWKGGQRIAMIGKAEAFGASWSGSAEESRVGGDAESSRWRFGLHADHLEAAELDRWAGPRARPNWLQRLLPSLLGNSNGDGKASELLRRVSAEGELSADTITVEKVKLNRAHAILSMQDLHLSVRDAEAEWAGGRVRGSMQAVFSVSPKYEIAAEVDRVNLAQLPWIPGWAERWGGIASGRIHLATAGVGREELLKQVAGGGDIHVKNVDFHGWDVASSLESGTARTGVSHWSNGQGEFEVKDRVARFAAIQLDGPVAKTMLAGSLGFGQAVTLIFSPALSEQHGAARVRVMNVSGTSEAPRVVIENVAAVTPKP